MEPRLELRSDARPSLDDVGEDEGLVARIRDEIRRDGPMPFARFMELALYDPDGGYYRGADPRPGRVGDFLTAPELHPIFGATLVVAIEEFWDRLGRPDPFVIREHGAGTGALAEAMLDALTTSASPLVAALRYQPVEVDPRRVEAFGRHLAGAGFGAIVEPSTEVPIEGVVLANEVLDALPVHRVRRRGRDLRELAVDLGPEGDLVEVEIEPTTPALAARLADEGVELADGQTAEIGLAHDRWVAATAAGLGRGVLLVIDYGATADELYDPVRRRDGTLRAYVRHQVHADPYRHVGRQDLTAHVDLTALERAAVAAGLSTIGSTTQAEALMGLGIEARLQAIQADPATTFESYTLVRGALMRLLDPAAMGRFRMVAFGRGWPTDRADESLAMFRFHLPSRRRR
jgi:SAM-dependent MidA family methyltransferase